MGRLLVFVIMMAVGGMGAANFLSNNSELLVKDGGEVPPPPPPVSAQKTVQKKPIRISGTESIPRSAHGHYQAKFRFNNSTVEGIIDTGASTIALNKSTARRAGIRLRDSDFIYEVSTANGITRAARATISRVTIGSIRMNDVDALVLEDRALGTVLIGMSFLNRLRGFEYKSGNLILRR